MVDNNNTTSTTPTTAKGSIYLLRISLHHTTFRIPELLSISKLYSFDIEFISQDLDRGVLLVRLKDDGVVQRILERSVLVM